MSCKDTGPGIPEEEIPVVLSSFGQGSNAIKSAEQGAGLGLPIAKNLVDMHGGTFTLKSKVRIGTELIVDVPAGARHGRARPRSEVLRRRSQPRRRQERAPQRQRRCSRAALERRDFRDCVPPPRPLCCGSNRNQTRANGRSPSPCIKVCIVDPRSGLCRGCGRTLAEIAQLDSLQRRRARARSWPNCRARLRSAGSARRASAPLRSASCAAACSGSCCSASRIGLLALIAAPRSAAPSADLLRPTTSRSLVYKIALLIVHRRRGAGAVPRALVARRWQAALFWVVVGLRAGGRLHLPASSCATSATGCWPS